MQTTTSFGTFLVALLAASGDVVSARPSGMGTVSPRGTSQQHHYGGGSFEVRVRPRAATTYAHPALAAAKAVNKFGRTMPTHLDAIVQKFRTAKAAAAKVPTTKKRAGTGVSGSATTTPEDLDVAYITDISVGTPAQTLPMDFDTGSSDLWVFSTETSSSEVNGQKTYDPSNSSTAKKLSGSSWSISYGDGSTSQGNVYQDTVTIGNITVTGQAVESATEVSSSFTSDSESSGLVGLGMSTLNTVTPTAQKTFFDNAKSQLASAVFSADLRHDAAGTYTFGTIDSTKKIFYADLFNSSASLAGYWTFQSTGYQVGDGTTATTTSPAAASSSSTSNKKHHHNNAAESDDFGGIFGASASESTSSSSGGWFDLSFGKKAAASPGAVEARTVAQSAKQHGPVHTPRNEDVLAKRAGTTITGIADTGTTLLMLDDTVVADYYSQVASAQDSTAEGGYIFDCSETLPDFTFNVGDGNFTVPGEYINWAAVDTTNTTCYGGLQSDASVGFSIFGDIALKAGYVVFDGAQGRVGWAAKTLS